MKNCILMPCFIFLFFLIQLYAHSAVAAPLKITLAYENTPLPPLYLNEGENVPTNPGVAVELLQELDNRLEEIEITFRRTPWKRCLIELERGEVDGIFPGSFKKSREKAGVYPYSKGKVDPSKSLVSLSYYFYGLKTNPVVWDGQTITPKVTIAAPTGYSVVEDLRKQGLVVDDEALNTKQNLLKLAFKRVGLTAAQDLTADPLIKNDPRLKEITKLYPPLSTKPNYLLLSHQFVQNYPEISNKIWNELQLVRQEVLQKIAAKYIVSK